MTPRRTDSPIRLLARAAGSPAAMAGKIARFGGNLAAYGKGRELDARLSRLQKAGVIEAAPTRIQLVLGALDMLRFWISPASSEYYQRVGIDYTFHQILRFLEEPASLADPVGFFSTRDNVIGHLMQIVHANPRYDLELLTMWDDGLAELEGQVESMIAGTHPRGEAIAAIVEEPDYHVRLLDYVRDFRKDPAAPPPLRANVEGSARWEDLERTFGSLRTSMRYFCRLPGDPISAARHLFTVKEFPRHLGEPNEGETIPCRS
ncbi:hypothetical protein [Polyangium jinanense]|uniref:Uncharacterized protein n=1 Tax=Polyangium jinanense TaxID=2829994 RepID=A0A9X4B0T1_9BACT|nr:hypothetical protein [Polyangium jinanense]MDC3989482.1 hypothetical protein [Polyangium jinanense]